MAVTAVCEQLSSELEEMGGLVKTIPPFLSYVWLASPENTDRNIDHLEILFFESVKPKNLGLRTTSRHTRSIPQLT